tara:strand:- start:512 stop:682 length:171 start_codon:yes stop_codon:yes gene_type:complete
MRPEQLRSSFNHGTKNKAILDIREVKIKVVRGSELNPGTLNCPVHTNVNDGIPSLT